MFGNWKPLEQYMVRRKPHLIERLQSQLMMLMKNSDNLPILSITITSCYQILQTNSKRWAADWRIWLTATYEYTSSNQPRVKEPENKTDIIRTSDSNYDCKSINKNCVWAHLPVGQDVGGPWLGFLQSSVDRFYDWAIGCEGVEVMIEDWKPNDVQCQLRELSFHVHIRPWFYRFLQLLYQPLWAPAENTIHHCGQIPLV